MSHGITNIEINPNWLYHQVTEYNIGKFIVSDAIKSRNQIQEKSMKHKASKNNGKYYISLAKKTEDDYDSSYNAFIDGYYAFVIEDIEAKKRIEKDKIKEYIKG